MWSAASVVEALRGHWNRWVQQRLPAARATTLNQHKIFIVPSKTAVGLLLLIALLFLLGINFQNSLVYIICFWLLALLLLTIFYTWRNLAGLTITALGVEPCFVGETAVLAVELARPAHQMKYALELAWEGEDCIHVDLVAAQTVRVKLSHRTHERGYFKPPRLRIATHFPTGLAVAWSYAYFDVRGVVYPAPIEKAFQPSGNASPENVEDGRDIAGGSHDFGGIRDYQQGDGSKRIHWAKYAQTGKLYTKTFVDYASHALWLDWEELPMPGIEVRLSHLCRKVLEFHQEQREYGLRIPGTLIAPGKGEAHKVRCLQALALFGVQDA